MMSDEQFSNNFRMTKLQLKKLIDFIKISTNKTICLKIYTFLYFISHILVLIEKSEKYLEFQLLQFSKKIQNVAEIIFKISEKAIKFPDLNEMITLEQRYISTADIEGMILTIDGTYIPISKPVLNPFNYFNRKGYFSINLIVLVDYRMRFRGSTYGFGASHDNSVLRNISLINTIENNLNDQFLVLGDRAFHGFSKIKITEGTRRRPLSAEQSILLRKQRLIVENVIGLFKNKFKRFDVRSLKGEKINNIKILL